MGPIMVEKDYSWKHDIMTSILNSCETGMVPNIQIPQSNVIPVKPPKTKDELLVTYQSRVGKKLAV